jgi:nitroimidazol reductase NimA-like FMN-containing flavoprotein (pyridoxamine 5'-phosphate oxidase superfamily)
MTARPSDRVRVRRGAVKGRYDWPTIAGILDRAIVAHVALVRAGAPYCVPTLFAQLAGDIYLHGSAASTALRVLASGDPACLTVTTLHGLVLARSAFEHSANYESVVAFGRCAPVHDRAERLAALEAFTEKLLPGRWSEVREPTAAEVKATGVLRFEVDEASAKRRCGPPDDDASTDAELDVWAGEVPVVTSFGAPVPSPGLRPGILVPDSVRRIVAGRLPTRAPVPAGDHDDG